MLTKCFSMKDAPNYVAGRLVQPQSKWLKSAKSALDWSIPYGSILARGKTDAPTSAWRRKKANFEADLAKVELLKLGSCNEQHVIWKSVRHT